MRKKNKLGIFFVLSLLCLISTSDVNAKSSGIGFEVGPIFSSHQIDSSMGYYYLQTVPNEPQTLELEIVSSSDEDLELITEVENAVSQSVGDIGYSTDIKRIDDSLKNPISEIVVPEEKSFILKKGERKVIKYTLTPPGESYDGIKAGRLAVMEKPPENSSGVGQRFKVGIGIILSESGDMFNDGNELKIGKGKVKALINKGAKAVHAEIVNPQPKTIENLEVTSYVTKKGSSEKIKERLVKNFTFAPTSKVNYEIPWGLTDFQTGEYTFHFYAKNEFETFEFKEDFKIRAEDARKLNNEAAFSVKTTKFMKIAITLTNIILLLLSMLIFVRNKNWVKELKSRKRNKKSKKNRGNRGKGKKNKK